MAQAACGVSSGQHGGTRIGRSRAFRRLRGHARRSRIASVTRDRRHEILFQISLPDSLKKPARSRGCSAGGRELGRLRPIAEDVVIQHLHQKPRFPSTLRINYTYTTLALRCWFRPCSIPNSGSSATHLPFCLRVRRHAGGGQHFHIIHIPSLILVDMFSSLHAFLRGSNGA